MKMWEQRYDLQRKLESLEKLIEARDPWKKAGNDQALMDDAIDAHFTDLLARWAVFEKTFTEWQEKCRSERAVQASDK